jgi:hypothetical protein
MKLLLLELALVIAMVVILMGSALNILPSVQTGRAYETSTIQVK